MRIRALITKLLSVFVRKSRLCTHFAQKQKDKRTDRQTGGHNQCERRLNIFNRSNRN